MPGVGGVVSTIKGAVNISPVKPTEFRLPIVTKFGKPEIG